MPVVSQMPEFPDLSSSSRSEDREDRFAFVRMAGAGLGLVLIVTGAWLSFMMFTELYSALKEPRTFGDRLDRWENVIRGKAVLLDAATEDKPVGFRTPSDPEGDRKSVSIARPLAEIMALTARPTAAGLIIVLFLILIRISLGLIQAGGGLVNLALSDKELMKRLLRELGVNRTPK